MRWCIKELLFVIEMMHKTKKRNENCLQEEIKITKAINMNSNETKRDIPLPIELWAQTT